MANRFAALSNPDFRTLWIGGMLSFMGVQMQFFLRGILAWELTEREDRLGAVFLVFGLALLVATPLGGVASDRMPKRTVMLVSGVGLMISALGMGIAVVTDIVAFWMLMVASAIQGVSFGFFGPARVAMATEIVGRENIGNALSLQSLAMNGTRVFAPSVAGALVGWSLFGIGPTYIVAATIATLALVMTWLLPNPPAALTGEARPFRDIADGVRYVNANPAIRNIVLTAFAVLIFAFSYVSFIPALVEGEFGLSEAFVGYFASASSAGALAAGLWVAGQADSPRAQSIMTYAGLLFAAMVVGLGLAPNYWVSVAVVVIAGAGTTAFQTLSNTLALQQADAEFQGRVQSIMMLGFAGFGISAFPLGVLARAIGLQPTLTIMGSVAFIAVLAYKISGGIVSIARQPQDEPVPG